MNRFAAIALSAALLGAGPEEGMPIARPIPRVQTEPVPSAGDAADDPAIWIHPTDPVRSLVLGTDKKGGLHAYALDGRPVQQVSPRSQPNNVDLIYDVRLPGGAGLVDLAVASVRQKGQTGVKVWRIDRATGTLAELGAGPTFASFGGRDAYGLCTYPSPRDGSLYVFVSDHDGLVEQYRLDFAEDPANPVRAALVRTIRVGSQAEGLVADRERGRLYVGEEDVAIWEYGAEPEAGSDRTAVARVGEHGLAADVEGLALYYAPDEGGYLIASSQGNNSIAIFERAGTHRHVLTVDPVAVPDGTIGDLADTDGLDVSNERTSDRFPRGLLVVQDGKNVGRQNFKLFGWDDVAGSVLRVDTTASARRSATTAVPPSPNR